MVTFSSDDRAHPELKSNGLTWSLIGLAGAFLAWRIWARIRGRLGLWWDDYFLIVATFFLLACGILLSLTFADHFMDVVVESPRVEALYLASISCSTVAIALSKTACAATLHRIVRSRGKKRAVCFLLATTVSFDALAVYSVLVVWSGVCGVPYMRDDFTLPWCMPLRVIEASSLVFVVYSGVMDFVLAFIPWLIVRKLPELPRRDKLALGLVMSFGSLCGIVVILRIRSLVWFMTGQIKPEDTTAAEALLAVYCAAEPAICIMVQTFPVLRPIVQHALVHGGAHEPRRAKGAEAAVGASRTLVQGLDRQASLKGQVTTMPDERRLMHMTSDEDLVVMTPLQPVHSSDRRVCRDMV